MGSGPLLEVAWGLASARLRRSSPKLGFAERRRPTPTREQLVSLRSLAAAAGAHPARANGGEDFVATESGSWGQCHGREGVKYRSSGVLSE